MSSKRKIPWVVRVAMAAVLLPFALFFFGTCAFFEWLVGRLRR